MQSRSQDDTRREVLAPRARSAVTAIEFLITITVIGILAAILLPHGGTSAIDDLRSAAQIVMSDLAYARNLAVSNNSTYQLSFDVARNEYTLRHTGSNTALDILPKTPYGDYSGPTEEQTQRMEDLFHGGSRVRLAGVVARGDGYVSAINNIAFESLGNTSRSDESIIWLSAGQGSNRKFIAIHVAAVTGLTAISKIYGQIPADSFAAPVAFFHSPAGRMSAPATLARLSTTSPQKRGLQ